MCPAHNEFSGIPQINRVLTIDLVDAIFMFGQLQPFLDSHFSATIDTVYNLIRVFRKQMF